MPRDPRAYITVHNGMPEHPKVDPLSDAAFRGLIEAWCLCSRTRNDGRIPKATWLKKIKPKARKELLAIGLATDNGETVDMHDYLDHQTSAAEIEETRRKRAQAGSVGGKRKAQNVASAKAHDVASATANAQANGVAEPQQISSPDVPEVEVEKRSLTYVGSTSHQTQRERPRGGRASADRLNATAHSREAHSLATEYANACTQRPPGKTINGVALAADDCLASGYTTSQVAEGIRAWEASTLTLPSQIPDFVHQTVNRSNGAGPQPISKAEGWLNLGHQLDDHDRKAIDQ